MRIGDGVTGQRQCLAYDGRQRLGHAWTTTAECADRRPDTGPHSYDLRYTYDAIGNVASVVDDGDERRYAYAAVAAGRTLPHATSAVGGERGFRYDANGDMTYRAGAGRALRLLWTPERRLANARTMTGIEVESYVYGADGTRLIRRTPTGHVLYLDGMELTAGRHTVTAARFYSAGDGTVAARRASGMARLLGNAQGSVSVAVGALDTVTRRRYTPFGADRGGTFMPTDHGFLGQVHDEVTGLVYLNARYYDAAIGRFASVDPKVDEKRPQTLNGYAYGLNNPATFADPAGLSPLPAEEDPVGDAVTAIAKWMWEGFNTLMGLATTFGTGRHAKAATRSLRGAAPFFTPQGGGVLGMVVQFLLDAPRDDLTQEQRYLRMVPAGVSGVLGAIAGELVMPLGAYCGPAAVACGVALGVGVSMKVGEITDTAMDIATDNLSSARSLFGDWDDKKNMSVTSLEFWLRTGAWGLSTVTGGPNPYEMYEDLQQQPR